MTIPMASEKIADDEIEFSFYLKDSGVLNNRAGI